jgi:Tol biopolymer transport system component
MKKCPHCGREYDLSMMFCLDDGTELLYGPGPVDEPATAVLHVMSQSSEADTRAQVSLTDPTTVFPGVANGIQKSRTNFKALLFGLPIILIVAVAFAYYELSDEKSSRVSFESAKFTRVTNVGRVLFATISPDGKWLAYAVGDGQLRSLWLQQVAVQGSSREIIPPADVNYRGLAFSPDGNYLYYSLDPPGAAIGSLYQMPVNGGNARKILDNIAGSVSFSPDGKRITYYGFQNDEDQIMVADADGSDQRKLAGRHGREYFYDGAGSPAWSPDGKTIATSIGWNDPTKKMGVAILDPDTGAIKTLDTRNFSFVDQLNWLSDGSGLLLMASETEGEVQKIWQIAYPSGEAQKIAHDLNAFGTISLTKDSNTIASVRFDGISNIWVAPLANISLGAQITQGTDSSFSPAFCPDGKIVYARRSGDVQDLFIIDPTGGMPKQLTVTTDAAGTNAAPAVSPDGKTIVFVSDRGGIGAATLWKMNIDGSDPKQVNSENSRTPAFSPGGKEVIYVSMAENLRNAWKVSIDGGTPVRLTNELCLYPRYSPDGKLFLCSHRQDGKWMIGIFSADGGDPVKTFPEPGGFQQSRWMPDGRSIIYTATVNAATNFWIMPIDGASAKQVTNFTSESIGPFNISPDGKLVAFDRGTSINDVVLITGFRK